MLNRSVIQTNDAYAKPPMVSQAVRVGDLIFVSGHVAKDPVSGEIPPDIRDQTRSILKQLEAILKTEGSSLARIVKVTTFLVRAEDFDPYNDTYAEFFRSEPPARSSVVVETLISAPAGALLEIEAIACL